MAKLYNQNKTKRECEHTISCEVRDNMELWKQGAEAKIHKTDFYGKPCIVKERFSKSYRHPILDKSLTAQRVKSEVRAMLRCRMSGMILIRVVVYLNIYFYTLYMAKTVKHSLLSLLFTLLFNCYLSGIRRGLKF